MTNVVVLIKQVPDPGSERKLSDDFTIDRSIDPWLEEINERAVEEALKIKEANGGEVTVLTAGPASTTDAIRKALSMGADRAVHVQDDAIGGSDAVQTGLLLTYALGAIEGVDLVIAGNEATDGRVGAVPAIIAEALGLPQLTHMRKLVVDGDTVRGERETDEGIFELEASLPAIVSVNEKINEPRFPSFKGIMAAKKKEIRVLSLADINLESTDVGGANASTSVTGVTPKPPKQAGEKVVDEGDGGQKVAQFLIGQKII
ncbi:electron transfer flavoprotein subunit beta/FixA family protein [Tsukamurella sp. 8F]|uniref:electron transfer flavoprotein subunit beta/FixA family protein n=1 Tax=Tsukamurella sp. 8F TaxID=3031961 RepID=UPI0023B9AB07|nr:electron transfer flavoprotein subunit beta/FixA family protein [Tsukamurella sp. 8F]MDF0586070.1 electron transfer flavoprotein subunit beta/FixA family protein [Tsukamurella sp. 8F]